MIVVTLARKPIAESSASRNVYKHGTGALNIEASRVGWVGDKPSQDEWNRMGSSGAVGANGFAGQFNQGLKDAYAQGLVKVPSGRWPANVVFEHRPECVSLGGQKVAATSITNEKGAIRRTAGAHVDAGGHQKVGRAQPVVGYGDEDGNEIIEGWACVEGCPAALLDDQSGESKSAKSGVTFKDTLARSWKNGSKAGIQRVEHGDKGGASRFFKQFGGS